MRRIVALPRHWVALRAHAVLPLSSFFLNRNCRVDLPVEPLALLVSFDKCIVLAQVVADTGLPSGGTRFELVPGIVALDVGVDLLKVH
jgi:hypothetical protein